MKRTFLITLVCLGVSACAGAVPGNPQGYAGINHMSVEMQIPEGERGPKHVEIWGGKEQEAISFEIETQDGRKATYSASGVKAFDGQKARALVEEAVSSDVKEAFPGIVDSIVNALTKGM